jgi:hypothetical protein
MRLYLSNHAYCVTAMSSKSKLLARVFSVLFVLVCEEAVCDSTAQVECTIFLENTTDRLIPIEDHSDIVYRQLT